MNKEYVIHITPDNLVRVEELDRLPEGKAEFILGYAEGVIAMADRKEQKTA